MESLYKIADTEIRSCILDYLELAEASIGFSNVQPEHLNTDRKKIILLSGINTPRFDISIDEAVKSWERRLAIPFELETAITTGVYANIRRVGSEYLDRVESQSDNFKSFSVNFIQENPHLLPVFQRLAGIFSKDALKKIVGSSISDNSISRPAAIRLSELLAQRVDPTSVNKGEVLQRLETTLEGIVRDLVGRVLLESIVDSALRKRSIVFKRENEYQSLSGVLYNFRADFVMPDESDPLAFIEVRKSSSRHASLYAKDKMFSAINWKGKHKRMLGILVVDGEWTTSTLTVMASIFDYVMPISRIGQLTEILESYIGGDHTKLKWLVEFRVDPVIASPP